MDEISEALRQTAKELGWNSTRIGAAVGRAESTGRSWLEGTSTINGADLLTLLREMPGFAERLLPPKAEAVRGAA